LYAGTCIFTQSAQSFDAEEHKDFTAFLAAKNITKHHHPKTFYFAT